jgi:hypothetical protein
VNGLQRAGNRVRSAERQTRAWRELKKFDGGEAFRDKDKGKELIQTCPGMSLSEGSGESTCTREEVRRV